jgi:hypothetical protein
MMTDNMRDAVDKLAERLFVECVRDNYTDARGEMSEVMVEWLAGAAFKMAEIFVTVQRHRWRTGGAVAPLEVSK